MNGLNLAAWANEYNVQFQNVAMPTAIQPDQLCSDTRQLQPEDIYVPLRGEHFEGHLFLNEALQAGATWALCDRNWYRQHAAELQALPLALVDNTLNAYQGLAKYWRRQWGKPVIAITGSSGKTSTKEILAQVFEPFERVHRTELNYNNEIGVPKTLLGLREEHRICIVEMGMRGLGQIAELCAIAEPDLGLITNIGPVHLSELGSQERIAQAKWELADFLGQRQNPVIVNGDNVWCKEKARQHNGPVILCGSTAEHDWTCWQTQADATGQQIIYSGPSHQRHQLKLDLEGYHQAINLLCCVAALSHYGHQLPEDTQLTIPRLFGRQERHELQGRLLINDAYNANPDSMRAALTVLAQYTPRRVAVLGKMAELGAEAHRFHHELGSFCEQLQLDEIIVVGEEAQMITDGLTKTPYHYFTDSNDAVSYLRQSLQVGDKALFKASRSAQLEKVLTPLVTHFSPVD